MKGIRIFVRNIGSAMKSISRNFSLSAASVFCTTITLLIVGIAIVLSANINNFTKDLENTLTILVYVDKSATEEEISTIKSKILEIKNVKSDELQYKTKETLKAETIAAMCKKEDDLKSDASICKVMNSWTEETNPLESEFVISVKKAEELGETARTLENIDKVVRVQYSKDIVDKMLPVFDVVEKVTWIIIGGLIILTIFLICNTIKLTIIARKNEIEIMRLVGTSNFVIKLPFVIEGLFLGIIGSIIPVISVLWGYLYAFDKLDKHLFTNLIRMLDPLPFTIYVSLLLVGIGALVGMVGSYMTVRKYLKI